MDLTTAGGTAILGGGAFVCVVFAAVFLLLTELLELVARAFRR